MKTNITVAFYIKGQQKQSRSFKTYKEAQAFMQALHLNDKCDSYGIERDK